LNVCIKAIKAIFLPKYVRCVINLFHGEKSGKKIGIPSNIVAINAEIANPLCNNKINN